MSDTGTTLKGLNGLVAKELATNKECRNNDTILVLEVWVSIIAMAVKDLPEGSPEAKKLLASAQMLVGAGFAYTSLGLPSAESITRTRRYIQSKYEDLRPSESVRKARRKKQEEIEKAIKTEKRREELNAWLKKGTENK